MTATHAVADGADRFRLHRLAAGLEEFKDRAAVLDHHGVGELGRRSQHLLLVFLAQAAERNAFALVVHVSAADLALAVIKIRHHAVVADGRDAAREVVKLFPHTPYVHVEDDRRKRTVLLRMGDECLHSSGGSRDFDKAILHGVPSQLPATLWPGASA